MTVVTPEKDELDFEQVFLSPPVGVRVDRVLRSPAGPFDVIFADDLVVYRRPQQPKSERMDYRIGDPQKLRQLADSVAETSDAENHTMTVTPEKIVELRGLLNRCRIDENGTFVVRRPYTVARAASELREALPALLEAAGLLEIFIDDDPCSLDHCGYCQAHGWMDESECHNARARRLLGMEYH
jgi:hypothetical protein